MTIPESRIEGIRKTNAGSWAVVLSYPVVTEDSGPGDYTETRAFRLGSEFKGRGSKAKAIRAAGTNHVVELST